MQRHRGMSVLDLVRNRFRLSGLSMPQLWSLTGHAEARIHHLIAVVSVIKEVDIAVGKLAMHEGDARICFGLAVVEVGSHIQRLQSKLSILPCVHFALAYGLHATSIAKQLVIQLFEFSLVVGQAWGVRGLRAGYHRTLLNQFAKGAQHWQ